MDEQICYFLRGLTQPDETGVKDKLYLTTSWIYEGLRDEETDPRANGQYEGLGHNTHEPLPEPD